jgi:hypothetical protein
MKWKSFPCFMNAREIIPGQELMQKQSEERRENTIRLGKTARDKNCG